MRHDLITVFGGSGFVGRHLVRRLMTSGATVRVAVRDPESALFLNPMGNIGQIVPIAADVLDPATVAAAVEGAASVVNLVGILHGRGRYGFDAVHGGGASNIAQASAAAGVRTLVQISAIGADADSPAAYGRSKAAGEAGVRAAFPHASILRPSIIFGPEDLFFNMFAGIMRISPLLPIFGCPTIPKLSLFSDGKLFDIDLDGDGGTRFQPVYVGDVADAIVRCLDGGGPESKTYELGGPRVYSSREMMAMLLDVVGRQRFLAPIPFWQLSFAASFLEKWPTPLLTRDQVRLLRRDNVVSEDALGLDDLGLTPAAAEAILPTYLARFRLPRQQASRAV